MSALVYWRLLYFFCSYDHDPESSDGGIGTAGNELGYSGLPSDTDTSAFDSDGAGVLSAGGDSGSGQPMLQHGSQLKNSKADRWVDQIKNKTKNAL